MYSEKYIYSQTFSGFLKTFSLKKYILLLYRIISKMIMELNCISLGKTSLSDSFTVRVCDINNINGDQIEFGRLKIGSLKYLICLEIKNEINIDRYNDLKLWKADKTLGYKLKDILKNKLKKITKSCFLSTILMI